MGYIVGYKIVSHKDAQDTEDEVQALLKDSWEVHGDLKVANNAYSQAMVKTESYGVPVVDYNLFVTIDELDGIKYAIESISDAIGNIATGLGGMAMGLSDQLAGASPDPKPTKAKRQPSKRKPSKK